MAATAPKSFDYEVEVEDVEYLRHGDTPLLARLFKPRGTGPFPAVVELHGGAWCLGDRLQDTSINEQLARNGILVAALDFRVPPAASYPGSAVDINYGIRWLKREAASLGSRPEMVCTFGISSGGHLAMLLGMRPQDSRYSAIPVAGTASSCRLSYIFRIHVISSIRGPSSNALSNYIEKLEAVWTWSCRRVPPMRSCRAIRRRRWHVRSRSAIPHRPRPCE